MKCTCKTCRGKGVVVCEDCDGEGETGFDIRTLETGKLNPRGKHFVELMALKGDAVRVLNATNKLIQLVPERADSYRAQMAATIAAIETQAEKLWKEDQ